MCDMKKIQNLLRNCDSFIIVVGLVNIISFRMQTWMSSYKTWIHLRFLLHSYTWYILKNHKCFQCSHEYFSIFQIPQSHSCSLNKIHCLKFYTSLSCISLHKIKASSYENYSFTCSISRKSIMHKIKRWRFLQ